MTIMEVGVRSTVLPEKCSAICRAIERSDGEHWILTTVLVAAISKKIGGRPSPPVEKINEKLEAMTFTALNVTPGDFTTDPTDPVATADGKLHFAVVKGDQIIKISPPKGDFLLLQLRSINWFLLLIVPLFLRLIFAMNR
jgi:hypothetical protein